MLLLLASFRPLIGVIISNHIVFGTKRLALLVGFRPLIGVIISNRYCMLIKGGYCLRFRPLIGVIISNRYIGFAPRQFLAAFPSPYRGYHF